MLGHLFCRTFVSNGTSLPFGRIHCSAPCIYEDWLLIINADLRQCLCPLLYVWPMWSFRNDVVLKDQRAGDLLYVRVVLFSSTRGGGLFTLFPGETTGTLSPRLSFRRREGAVTLGLRSGGSRVRNKLGFVSSQGWWDVMASSAWNKVLSSRPRFGSASSYHWFMIL